MNLLTPLNKKFYPLSKESPILLNESRIFTVNVIPPTRANTTQYYIGDYIILSTFDTKMYKCTQSGISGAATPTFLSTPSKTTVDGGVVWECVEYSALLLPTRTVTSVSISSPAEVTVSSNTNTTSSFTFKLNYPTAPLKDFTLVADITSSLSSIPEIIKANLYFNTYQ